MSRFPAQNGRDAKGRFQPGNACSPGRGGQRLAEWRAVLREAVTPDRMRAVVEALLTAAEGGEGWAIRELLDRTLGRAVASDFLDRLDALEERLAAGDQQCET